MKPAHEPIVVARKPLIGTVAANVMAHGTGALNINGTRIGTDAGWSYPNGAGGSEPHHTKRGEAKGNGADPRNATAGRWPANLVLTHSPDCDGECVAGCPVAALNEQSGTTKSQRSSMPIPKGHSFAGETYGGDGTPNGSSVRGFNDSGGASRFFATFEWDPIADTVPFRYVAKPSKRERNAGLDHLEPKFSPTMNDGIGGKPHNPETATPKANHHPTVKPVELMRWLVRLVTPPGGTVLDPFLGSGTTAVAAILEGFNWIGCELTDDYLPIIHARIEWAENTTSTAPTQPILTLFGDNA